ncbi:MAG: hypothetical protein COA84_10975 [Robiginitomaculum sp.]|nr:MAG: hypothetical protein COA84_10975 [Robiginitomaculum sp.]
MKIESVHIKNFRAFKDCEVKFEDYTCLVGSNGVGKSTILTALNVFFGNQESSTTDIKNFLKKIFLRRTQKNQLKSR